MFKINRLGCALMLCTCAGIAYAGANKIRSFETFHPEPLAADGMAILNYAAGQNKTIIQIIVSDFTPHETYGVRLTDGANHSNFLEAFVTDESGHGTFHSVIPGDKSTRGVELYVDANGDANFQDNELRAQGYNPG